MSFIEKDSRWIDSLGAQCLIYEHRSTGCEVVHIKNEDPENLFAYMFRTPPYDSTGLPHIMEHTVLCGSRRYPLKDPFASLLKTSLNTFMNAMTSLDRTYYPASSSVEKDLFNLMRVYGDAVFFPLLRKEMFRQEGVRVEFSEDASPRFQGVVYNEMKGVYSDKDSIVARACVRSLFEKGPYAYDPGGDPNVIPSLSYNAFVDFHRRYYHPTNTCLFLYGNIETEKYLKFFEQRILSSFVRGQAASLRHRTFHRGSDAVHEISYPAQHSDQKNTIVKNWLLKLNNDVHSLDTARMVGELLIGNTSSPLYRELLESRYGKAITAVSGIDFDLYEPIFSVGLDEVEEENKEAVLDKIQSILVEIRDKGFDPDHVESIIAHTELNDREVRKGHREGLRLMRRVSRAWAYNSDIVPFLETNKRIEWLRSEYSRNPGIFQDWVDEFLLENNHTSVVLCRPDQEKIKKDLEEEETRLTSLVLKSEHDLREDASAVFALQSTPEAKRNIDKMPKLLRSDVPKEIRKYDVEQGDAPVWNIRQDLFTNQMHYVVISFESSGIPDELLIYIPLLMGLFDECGTKSFSSEQLQRNIDTYTTGIHTSAGCMLHRITGHLHHHFFIKTGFHTDNLDMVVRMCQELLTSIDVSQHSRIRETVEEMIIDMSNSLVRAGHIHAMYRADRQTSPVAEVEELWYGITQLEHIRRCAEDIGSVTQALRSLIETLFVSSRMKVSSVQGSADRDSINKFIQRITMILPEGTDPISTRVRLSIRSGMTEIIEIPSQVSFNALSLRGMKRTDPLYPASLMLSRLLSAEYFWKHIRMKNGAYGAFAVPKGSEGIYTFVTYRDPNIDDTFAIFGEALEYYMNKQLGEEEIDGTLFSVLGSEFRSVPPYQAVNEAFHYALSGIDDEFRQTIHNGILAVKPADVKQVAKKLHQAFNTANRVVISGKEIIERSEYKTMKRTVVTL